MNETAPTGDRTVYSLRSKTIQAVQSPLGFFALALLIVEAFLLGAGSWFELSESWKIVALGVGVLLFLALTGAVVWLVVRYPQNLVFSEESHVQYARMKMFGSEAERLTERDLEALPAGPPPERPVGQLTESSIEAP